MKIREVMAMFGFRIEPGSVDKIKRVDAALDDLVGGLQGVQAAAKDAAGFFAKSAATFAAGYGVVITGAAKAAQGTAAYAEEVIRSSEALDVNVGRFQEMKFAFSQLGASTDDLMDAYATLTDRALDATSGSKNYIESFRLIGIEAAELKNKKPQEIFDLFASRAMNAEDRTKAITAAVRLLGDDLGRRIMPAMTSGAESFEEWSRIARETGIVMMPKEALQRARDAQFSFRALAAIAKAFARRMGLELIPTFHRLADWIIEVVKNAGGLDGIFKRLEKTIKLFDDEMEGLKNNLVLFNRAVQALGGYEKVITGIAFALTGLFAVMAGNKMMNLAQALTKAFALFQANFLTKALGGALAGSFSASLGIILLIAASIVAWIFLIEDFVAYMRGGESVLGDLIDGWEKISWLLKPIAVMANVIKGAFEIVLWIAGGIVDLMTEYKEELLIIWDILKVGIIAALTAFAGFLSIIILAWAALAAVVAVVAAHLLSIVIRIGWLIKKTIEFGKNLWELLGELPYIWELFSDAFMSAMGKIWAALRPFMAAIRATMGLMGGGGLFQFDNKQSEFAYGSLAAAGGQGGGGKSIQVNRGDQVINITSSDPEAAGKAVKKAEEESNEDMLDSVYNFFTGGPR